MSLLNIFHTGGLTLGLSIVFFGLAAWFWHQATGAHNSVTWARDAEGNVIDKKEKTPYWKINKTYYAIALIVIYLIIMIFGVAPDYKGI